MNAHAYKLAPKKNFRSKHPFISLAASFLLISLLQWFEYALPSIGIHIPSEFNQTYILSSGTVLAVLFALGPIACFASVLSFLVFGTIGFANGQDSSFLYFKLLQGFCISLQALVIYFSYFRTRLKGNPLYTSHNLILYIGLCAITSGILSIPLSLYIEQSIITPSAINSSYISVLFPNITSLLVIPVVLFSWENHSSRIRQFTHPLEWFVWLSTATAAVYFINISQYGFILLVIPLLMWSSIRFNQFTCCVTILISTLILSPGFTSISNTPPFDLLPNYTLQAAWLLLLLSTLYFSALRIDQRKIEVKLEDMVEQRTLDLLSTNQELKDEVFIRERTELSLINSSRRYKALFETAGIPIIVLDAKFKIKQWNTAAELQFGYTKEQVLGSNFIGIFIPESLQDETAWKFTKVIETGMNRENLETQIESSDGLTHTMLWNMSRFSDKDQSDPLNQLLLIGQNISDIRKTQNQLHYLAHFDALTDTANRRLFEDRCAQAIQSSMRHKHKIALIGLDIDHFKRINDTLGHDIGDQFLIILAKRLKDTIRKEDTIARLGGDEFAILLASISGREGAEKVARNILENITQPVTIKGNQLIVTSSIGIALCPNDGTEYPDLLKNADMAMYRAKNAGRNNIQFYSPEMNSEMQRQHTIEHELRSAFKENQFRLYYQPIVDIESGEILALEALLRWKHPDKGLIKSSDFIDIAEQTGQLHDIGEWVLKNACLQGRVIHEWSKKPIQIALNLSCRQFNHPQLIQMVKKVTKEARFAPQNLIFEMSESTITSNIDMSLAILDQLDELGVSLTIDSFGTGLSSLRQLKQIPVDIVKIDRTFVNGIPNDESNMAITETLLAIASQMDLQTFATGVETLEQEAFLKINGCRYAQGYLYTEPLPFKELADLFTQLDSGRVLGQGEQIILPFEKKNK